MDNKTIASVILLGLAVVLVALGPLFALWSWNHLFGEFKTFAYDFWNWAAVVGIGSVFKTYSTSKSK